MINKYQWIDLGIFCLGPLTVLGFFRDWQWLINISATAVYLSAWLLWRFRTAKTAHCLLLWILIYGLILGFIYAAQGVDYWLVCDRLLACYLFALPPLLVTAGSRVAKSTHWRWVLLGLLGIFSALWMAYISIGHNIFMSDHQIRTQLQKRFAGYE